MITVGATDTANTVTSADDFAAPWSSWGPIPDGFAKPDSARPAGSSTAPRRLPPRCTPATPITSSTPDTCGCRGRPSPHRSSRRARRYLVLAAHPGWTPDQVKGALMVGQHPTAGLRRTRGPGPGVGEVDARRRARRSPTRPNADRGARGRLLVPGSGGRPDAGLRRRRLEVRRRRQSPVGGGDAGDPRRWGTASWSAEMWGTDDRSAAAEMWGTNTLEADMTAAEMWGTSDSSLPDRRRRRHDERRRLGG